MKPCLSPLGRVAPLTLAVLLSLSSSCKDTTPKQAADQGDAAPVDVKASEPITPTPAPLPLPAIAPQTVDSARIADVGDVVMSLQLPSGTAVRDLAPVIEKFAPGTSMALQLQLPMALRNMVGVGLDGAKLDAPISLIAVKPTLHDQPLALLVQVQDLAKLEAQAKAGGRELRHRDGLALIGPAEVVAAAEAFAFAHLRGAPDHTELIIYPAQLADSLAPQIELALTTLEAELAATNPGMQALMRTYMDTLLGVTRQTERFVISVSAGQTSTDLQARAYPIAGSELASFVAAQTPTTHALLSKLPNSAAQTMLMSGDLHGGPATASIVAFTAASMSSMYGGALTTEAWTQILDAWIQTLDGQFAIAANFSLPTPGGQTPPGMSLQGLSGATDAPAMHAAWRAMIGALAKAQGEGASLDMMGMKIAIDYDEDALEHDGVPIDLYATKVDLDSLPADQRAMVEATGSGAQSVHFTAFDGVGALATADAEGSLMRALINAARGHAPGFQATAGLSSALATSTERGESLFCYLDMSTLAPAADKIPFRGLVLAFGKQGEALSLRMSIQD